MQSSRKQNCSSLRMPTKIPLSWWIIFSRSSVVQAGSLVEYIRSQRIGNQYDFPTCDTAYIWLKVLNNAAHTQRQRHEGIDLCVCIITDWKRGTKQFDGRWNECMPINSYYISHGNRPFIKCAHSLGTKLDWEFFLLSPCEVWLNLRG